MTSIFVTHDQDEAFTLCDRVAVLWKGKIQQVGTPTELMEAPENAFVAGFIGNPNALRGTIKSHDVADRTVCVDIDGFVAHASVREPMRVGSRATIFIRPEKVKLNSDSGRSQGKPQFTIKDWIHLASGRELWIDGPVGLRCCVSADSTLLNRGDAVWPSWRAEDAHAFEDVDSPVDARRLSRIATAPDTDRRDQSVSSEAVGR